jgi:hypothetical protein
MGKTGRQKIDRWSRQRHLHWTRHVTAEPRGGQQDEPSPSSRRLVEPGRCSATMVAAVRIASMAATSLVIGKIEKIVRIEKNTSPDRRRGPEADTGYNTVHRDRHRNSTGRDNSPHNRRRPEAGLRPQANDISWFTFLAARKRGDRRHYTTTPPKKGLFSCHSSRTVTTRDENGPGPAVPRWPAGQAAV